MPESPPSSIDILQESPFNLTVTWSVPMTPNGIITHYTLYVDYKNGTVDPLTFQPSITSYIITGLSPYQQVGVKLSASTVIGAGPNSTREDVRTAQTGKKD